MFSGLLGSFLGKFEKAELYTFLVGCAVSLAYVLRFFHEYLFNTLKNYYSIFLFLFMFLLFSGVVYLVYSLLTILLTNIIALLLTKKHALGRWLRGKKIKQSKKSPIRYLPAFYQLLEFQHIVLLITSGLVIILPNLAFIVTTYFYSHFILHLYYLLIVASLLLSFYIVWVTYVFEMCHQEGCFEVTNDRDYFLNKLNENRASQV